MLVELNVSGTLNGSSGSLELEVKWWQVLGFDTVEFQMLQVYSVLSYRKKVRISLIIQKG